jgi:hypothetical protein
MTQLIVDVKQKSDLEEVLSVLNRLKLSFTKREENPVATPQNRVDTEGYLSIETIKKRYPNEWVFVASPQKEGIKIVGGIVLAHNADKRLMALEGRDLIKNHASTTHFYTGEMPKYAKIGIIKKIGA